MQIYFVEMLNTKIDVYTVTILPVMMYFTVKKKVFKTFIQKNRNFFLIKMVGIDLCKATNSNLSRNQLVRMFHSFFNLI